jgi:protein-S-isoprenylcysteine O-methyltransferase Ste14
MAKPKMIAVQVVGVGVQLGLAIAGWGGWTAFFAHRALVAIGVMSVVFLVVAMFSDGNMSAGEREDKENRWVLTAFGLLSLLTAYLPAYTDRIGFWTLDGDAIRWVGVVVFVVGCTLRIWPVFVLGNRFSGLVAIQPGHTLVTTGIYRAVRNPSYLGMVVALAGWSLAFRAGVGLVLTALILPPLVVRMHAEERLLRSQFGGEYEAYCARTRRLIPGIY